MNPSFEKKVALLTGAGAGMGLATARAFAEAGAAVVLADFNENAVRHAADTLIAAGHRAFALQCDVSDEAQVETMVNRTVAEFGRLDAAFNNAGFRRDAAKTPTRALECSQNGGSGESRSLYFSSIWPGSEDDGGRRREETKEKPPSAGRGEEMSVQLNYLGNERRRDLGASDHE
jgi:NAD(P)-dependent dehydrogenase (short-subunit alcohol dehydrogenase family)